MEQKTKEKLIKGTASTAGALGGGYVGLQAGSRLGFHLGAAMMGKTKDLPGAAAKVMNAIGGAIVGAGVGTVGGAVAGGKGAHYAANKYLEKAAKFSHMADKAKAFVKDPRTQWTVGAGGAGAIVGSGRYFKTHDEDWLGRPTRKFTKEERKKNAIVGATTGAIFGSMYGYGVGSAIKNIRNFDEYARRSAGGGGGGGRYSGYRHAARSMDDIYKDLGATGKFKTKAEAKTHYRRMASKWHPDKAPSEAAKATHNAKMQQINKAWDEFNKHPDGFEKLANSYLEKIASIDWAKAREVVKANPGAVIGATLLGAEGLSSTTRKHNEHPGRYHLRQVKNTVIGIGTGAAAGKLAQEGLKKITK